MPWEFGPSIQLGVLHGLLERHGIAVASRSLFVDAIVHFTRTARVRWADYIHIASRYFEVGLGDWIFAVPPFLDDARDGEYFELLRRKDVPGEMIDKAVRMKRVVPGFLDRCVDQVLDTAPAVVGFTTTFSQSVPSLVLARLLKERRPDLITVFGGANCDGPMGAALHREFPWIDVVVRGEAERVLPPLIEELLAGRSPTPRSGLCYRSAGASVAVPLGGDAAVAMDDVATPDYDEFFERIDRDPELGLHYRPYVKLPFESSRGCWWGAKSQCTFCGLNGTTIRFRSKPAERVVAELRALAERHRVLEFQAVDNIIDLDHVARVMPALRDAGLDLRLFYETKSNLKRPQLRLLRDAGVHAIQPGIESLSTPILKLMKKGVSALHNVRLLKWCAELGVRVMWNLIYGFPGEPRDEYARMAALVPALAHLEPPSLNRLHLDRFSPYHDRPADHGIEIGPPLPHYRFLYPVDDAALADIAYAFSLRYADGRDPEAYIGPLRDAVKAWQANWQIASRPLFGAGSLRRRRGPGFVLLCDRRSGFAARDHHLSGADAAIYAACEDGATPAEIARRLVDGGHASRGEASIRDLCRDLTAARLMFEEGDRFLALALPASPDAQPERTDDEQPRTPRRVLSVLPPQPHAPPLQETHP
jgi:ribosomal peptide maturation radical SAM protein 1